MVGSLTVTYWFYLDTRLLGQNTQYTELSVLDVKLCAHWRTTSILHFIENKHKFRNISKKIVRPHFQEKITFWHNSGAVATITQPTKKMLWRYTAGFISDNNSGWIFSEVKIDQNITLFCALVNCNHHAMTALFEYIGSVTRKQISFSCYRFIVFEYKYLIIFKKKHTHTHKQTNNKRGKLAEFEKKIMDWHLDQSRSHTRTMLLWCPPHSALSPIHRKRVWLPQRIHWCPTL